MEHIISRFVACLREHELRVSPGESIDAVRALGASGMSCRSRVQRVLRMTLVKNAADLPAFDRLFDYFFQPVLDMERASDQMALDDAIFSIEGQQMLGTNPDLINDDMSLAMVDANFSPEDLRELERLRELDLDQLDGTEMEIRLKGYRDALDRARPSTRPPQTKPMTLAFHQNLGQHRPVNFTRDEIEAMEDAVNRMIVRLKKDIRRVKNMENRGRIHVIRTIQKNYRNGMVPFNLALRRKRKQRPRLVVLCDVSFSVSHASQFMLLLLHTLHNRLMDVRSFIFNADIAEITEMLSNAPINSMLENIDSGAIIDLDDNSNYGHVLHEFKKRYLDNLRGKPAVIFIGDARNNYNEPDDWVLEQLREKAGHMLWLTPEDTHLWQRGDCLIRTYAQHCDRVEVVKSVDDLNNIVESLFRNIYLDQPNAPSEALDVPTEHEEYDYRSYYRQGAAPSVPEFDPTARSHW